MSKDIQNNDSNETEQISLDNETKSLAHADGAEAPEPDGLEVDETTPMQHLDPTSKTVEPQSKEDGGDLDLVNADPPLTGLQLPDLNYDPAQHPSAFDPRITGEASDFTVASPDDPVPMAESSQGHRPAQPFGDNQDVPPQGNPFADARMDYLHTGSSPADPLADQTAIKFGLLTWSLVLIAIGALVIAMPWWNLIDWPILGTIGLATMGGIMLLIALATSWREKRSKMR